MDFKCRQGGYGGRNGSNDVLNVFISQGSIYKIIHRK